MILLSVITSHNARGRNMGKPKVIFLDAVGTLFGVRGTVGQIYSTIAREFGVNASEADLNKAFIQGFRTAPPMAFPNVPAEEIPRREYEWWEAIAFYTFKQVGVLDQFVNFPGFFAELYRHFATATPWFVYPDVFPALRAWQKQGIELGIISNFDSRLHPVLDALSLTDFFSSITISTEVGAAKPSARLFHAGLRKHSCLPEMAWHVGDSQREDFEGATAVGMRAILIQRGN
jgi:putative hydrolase of the HAD superfamily